MDANAELFETFANDSLVRQFGRLDVSANEVPAVGVPKAFWMTVRKQHSTVAHKGSRCDRDPGSHGCTRASSCSGPH